MSGPKIDEAELERRRKAEIERARQERLRKIREETDKLNVEMTKARAQLEQIDRHLFSSARSVEKAQEMSLIIPKLYELKAGFKAQLTKALTINVPSEPDAISVCANRLAHTAESIIKNYFNEVKPLEERINDFYAQLEIRNKASSIFKDFPTKAEDIKNIEDIDFTIRMDNVEYSNIESGVKEKAEQILSEIEALVNSESIQESDMKDILAIANNIYRTAFETNSSFEAAAIEHNIKRAAIIKNIIIFDEIYQDYYAKYVDYLHLLNINSAVPISVTPKEKYCFDTIEELQTETQRIDQASKYLSERNYIREQIDEVMALFGYNLSEEVVLDMNQLGNHYICGNKSGQSAIHVHISDKKQIMMEIVGVGEGSSTSTNSSVNGAITSSSDLNESERDDLLQQQGGFCQIHPKIVEELGKRGVLLNAKSRKPPDLRHCKKITTLTAVKTTVESQSALINEHASERRRAKGMKAKLREMK